MSCDNRFGTLVVFLKNGLESNTKRILCSRADDGYYRFDPELIDPECTARMFRVEFDGSPFILKRVNWSSGELWIHI